MKLPILRAGFTQPEFIALVQSNNVPVCNLFAFTLASGGAQDFFTDLDLPITFEGTTYRANGLRISPPKFKIGVGVQVDEQEYQDRRAPNRHAGRRKLHGSSARRGSR